MGKWTKEREEAAKKRYELGEKGIWQGEPWPSDDLPAAIAHAAEVRAALQEIVGLVDVLCARNGIPRDVSMWPEIRARAILERFDS